jgi:hypothetical protein
MMKDMAKVIGWITLIGLTLAAIFFSSPNAEAVDSTIGFRMTSVASWGFDSSNYPPDSVIFYYAQSSYGGDADSMRRLTTALCEPSGYGAPDSLCRYTVVNIAQVSAMTHNPSGIFYWYLPDGQVLRDNSPQLTSVIFKVDSLFQSVSAAVDTEAVARSVWDDDVVSLANRTATATSAAGVGPDTLTYYVLSSADSTPIGGVSIWVYPNDGGAPWKNITESNGVAEFGLNAPDTILGYTWVSGWTQDTVPDSVFFTAAVADTLLMSQVVPAAPAAAGLTAVTFDFHKGTGDSTQNVIVRYKLYSPSTENWHSDSSKVLDPTEVFETRSDATGTATINVVPNDAIFTSGYQTGKTQWHIWAISPNTGKHILGEDGIKITVPTSASGLIWPRDF